MISFEHERLLLDLDPRTGSLMRVVDRASGRAYFDAAASGGSRSSGRLFRVLLPVERWSSHAADSWTSRPPVITRTGETMELRYPDLHTARGASGVEAVVRIEPGGPSEVLLTLRLTSHRLDGDVTDVLFPWLAGWTPGGAEGAGDLVLGGVRAMAVGDFPINRGMTFSRWHQRAYWTYPIDLYAPWVDVSDRDTGVGLISYQRSARNLGVFAENLAGYEPGIDLSMGFNHYLELRAGQSWDSPPVGISLHEGDWHATADRYSTWVDTWFVPPPTPEWARRTIGFQNVLFRGFDGTAIRPLDAIPEVAAAGVRAGVPHLCIWDYILLGEYGKLHDVPLHGFAANDREVLRRALADARREGARLSSLQNHRLVKPTSTLYREQAHDETCRRYDGSPFVEEYPGSLAHAMVITNHAGPMVHPVDARLASVRERVLMMMRDTLDLGFDSHFYDQPFENWPSYHPGRGPDGPDGAHAGTVELLRAVRQLFAGQSPEGIVIGEYCDVFASEAIDLWMSWYTDIEDLRRTSYSIPQTIQSWVVDADPAAASRAFAMGAQLCLTTHGGEGHLGDVPTFAAHVARLSALRDRATRIWSGRYRDSEGYEMDADGPVLAGGFEGPAGRAVVVAAIGANGRATIRLPDPIRGQSGKVRVLRLDGSEEVMPGRTVHLSLGANEVGVIEA